MDYFGSCLLHPTHQNQLDSFNPSGSMDYFGRLILNYKELFGWVVSILLGQWITLEEDIAKVENNILKLFQSFWVNGLLWKNHQ